MEPPKPDAGEILAELPLGGRFKSEPSKTRFLKALIESGGKIDKACELSGVGHGALFRWWKKDARFCRACEVIRKFLLFLLELDTVGEAMKEKSGKLRALELRAYRPDLYADGVRDAADEKELPYHAKVVELVEALKKKGLADLKLIDLNNDPDTTAS